MTKFLRAAVAVAVVGLLARGATAAPSHLEVALAYPDAMMPVALPPTLTEDIGTVQLASACEPSGEAYGDEALDGGACECGDSCDDSCDCGDSCCDMGCGCPPVWTVKTGAVILHRSRPDALTLVVPNAGPGRIATGGDFAYEWAGGPDISVMRRTARGNLWELRYFGALDFDSNTAQYGAVGNVRIGSFSNFGATNLIGDCNSTLHSTELNWRHPHSDRLSLLAGFRWIELNDDITYNITFPAFNADYNWHNTNHIYGGQLGADLNLWRLTGPLSINSTFKGGVYGNDANNDFTLRPSTGGMFDGGGGSGQVAFVGEMNLTTAYQLTRHIALRGGYQLLWIDGVALASDQLAAATQNSTQAGIDTDGDVFYHGAMLSADFTF